MSTETTDASRDAGDGIRWGAVTFGWVIAVLAGIAIGAVLRWIDGLLAEPSVVGGDPMATLVVISVVSGFLSYLAGGYAAARTARHSGGRHGALTAVFGLILGVALAMVLAIFGTALAEGMVEAIVPPTIFGPMGAAWAAGAVVFLVDLFGGFVGGKLGEPSRLDAERPG